MKSPGRSNRFFKRPRKHPMPSGPFLASRKLIGTNLYNNNLNFQIRYYSPLIGVTLYKENCMDIITTFGVRGKIEPKNGPEGIGCLRVLLKKRLLLSGNSKSLALLGYCYTIEGHHSILQCQNW